MQTKVTIGDFLAECISSGRLRIWPIDEAIVSMLGCSRSEAKRLIAGGGVDVNGKKITDVGWLCLDGDDIRVGKGRFYRLSL